MIATVGVNNGHDSTKRIATNGDKSAFTTRVGVFAGQAGRVVEHGFGIPESDAVLQEVCLRLVKIPTRVHQLNMYIYMY